MSDYSNNWLFSSATIPLETDIVLPFLSYRSIGRLCHVLWKGERHEKFFRSINAASDWLHGRFSRSSTRWRSL